MGNRSLLVGAATVEVDMLRYDELLHKEAELNMIIKLIKGGSISDVTKLLAGTEEVEHE